MCSRQIHAGFPSDDTTITNNLINAWIEPAAGVAAKTNYTDSIKLDGIAYINGSFYTTFKAISITQDEKNLYKIELPQIPHGLGNDEGVSTLQIKDDKRNITHPLIWITQAQKSYYQNMRKIPSKVLCYQEGKNVFAISTLILTPYTATVCMVSAGDPTDLDSELNVPADYLPVMIEFIKQQLVFERMQPKDTANDGQDAVITT